VAVQPTEVLEPPVAPPVLSSRTWRKTFEDISGGIGQRTLWLHLGLQDIKQKYRRSAIGPLWITISMGMMVTALGLLYSQLFQTPLAQKLPDVAVGFIVWAFISGCVLEGAEVFISNEGLIKQMPAPLTVHIFRLVWRQTLYFAHNMIVYVAILAIFRWPMHWTVITVIPGFALLMVNGVWVAMLCGVIATRFRDIPPIVGSFINMAMPMTPIMWNVSDITKNPNSAWRSSIADLNPFYHYIEILRDPLLGEKQLMYHWVTVLACTVVGWAMTLLVLRNYRARVSYWV
jgi:ABC-2 type transport system permease protein